jgi:hypothetical protein
MPGTLEPAPDELVVMIIEAPAPRPGRPLADGAAIAVKLPYRDWFTFRDEAMARRFAVAICRALEVFERPRWRARPALADRPAPQDPWIERAKVFTVQSYDELLHELAKNVEAEEGRHAGAPQADP